MTHGKMIGGVWTRIVRRKASLPLHFNCFHVLGIESSCDDTSAAVLNSSGSILGECHFSQSKIHFEAGGVLPNLAMTLHRKYLSTVVETSLQESKLEAKDLDAVAITVKPGLIMSLKEGVKYAKEYCSLHNKPLIPIHHMEAHALTVRMLHEVKFPFLTLLISGGHCLLALVKSPTEFYTLGETMDNSPGQLLDKMARRAKLNNVSELRGLPGGAMVEKAAAQGDPKTIHFPNVLTQRKTCQFSFSGLYGAAVRHIENQERKLGVVGDNVIPDYRDLCAALQSGITKHLCNRLDIAINYIEKKKLLQDAEKCVVVSGGVASNGFIREGLKFVCEHYSYSLHAPPPKLCTDNGAMIAWNGIERLRAKIPVVKPQDFHTINAEISCPLGENIADDVEMEMRDFKHNLKINKFINQIRVER